MRALVLATDIYTRGGIARYTSTLATALGQSLGAENVDVLAYLDWGEGESTPAAFRVVGAVSHRQGLGAKLQFAWRALRLAWRHYDLVIANHVGMAPVAALIRRCFGTPYWVACHGTEVWRRLPLLKRFALQGADLVLPVSQYTAGMLSKVNGVSPAKMRVLFNAIPADFARLLLATETESAAGAHRPVLRERRQTWEETPHPSRSAGTPSPQGRGLETKIPALSPGEMTRNQDPSPLPGGEGGPRPALSPAGAGQVRGPFAPGTYTALEGFASCNSGATLPHPLLLSVGGVTKAHEYKGVDTVIRAMPRILAAVPAAHYVVVGEGDNRWELERLAEREGVARRVKFVGEIRDEELATLYRTCDLFVMPSRVSECAGRWTGEGFGRVYAEAALAGKPVVGSRAGGAAEALLDGQTGLLVDPLSTDEIAAAIVNLLLNPCVAESMGRMAREWAAWNFSLPVMENTLEEMLEPYRVRANWVPSEAHGIGRTAGEIGATSNGR